MTIANQVYLINANGKNYNYANICYSQKEKKVFFSFRKSDPLVSNPDKFNKKIASKTFKYYIYFKTT